MEVLIVSSIIEQLNSLLIQEAELLRGVEDTVETVEMELRLMYAVLEHMEALEGPSEIVKNLDDKTRAIARDAENIVENFVIKKKQKRSSTFKLLSFSGLKDRHKCAKELNGIKVRIRDAFKGWEACNTWNQVGKRKICEQTVTVEEENVFLNKITNVRYAMEELFDMPTPNLFTHPGVITQVESKRDALTQLLSFLKDMSSAEELDVRERVWVQDFADIGCLANDAFESFIRKRGRWMNRWRLFKHLPLDFQDQKSRKEMEQIKMKFQDHCGRRWTYGIKEFEGSEWSSSRVSSIWQRRQPSSKAVINFPSLRFFNVSSFCQSVSILSVHFTPMHKLASRQRLDSQVESMRRDLRMMDALLKDVGGVEDLDERVKVWREQMRDFLSKAEVLENYICKAEQEKNIGVLKRCGHFRSRLKVHEEINRINSRLCDLSKLKRTYDIGSIKGRRGQSSLTQNPQETISATSESIEGFGNQNRERRYMVRKMNFFISKIFIGRLSLSDLEEKVKSIENEVKVIDALYQDVQAMEDQDRILRIWMEEMRVVARDAKEVVDNYHNKKQMEGQGIFNMIDSFVKAMNAPYKVAGEIRRIKNKIQDVSEMRLIYGIDFLKTREASNSMIQSLHQTRPLSDNVELRTIMARLFTDEEWSRVLEQLNQDQGPWKEAFNMIYKDLPIYLKKCLNYFRLFPEDFEVPARRLITLWVAEGFVNQKMVDKEPLENVAERYLSELIDRNMVQVTKKKLDGKARKCRLPRALQKLFLSKPRDTESPQDHTNTTSALSTKLQAIVHLADHLNEEDASFAHIHGDNTNISLRNYYRDVVSFLSFDTREGSEPGKDVENFLHQCISSRCFLLLRVLDLERVFRPKLPKTIGKLSQLRYLGLRWTYLETLPLFINKLLTLQTLDVKHTYISTLPRSIWKMHQLRHLYLSESYRSRFVPRPSGGSLMDLQTLWGVFVDEESPVKNGLDMLLNLRKLGLSCRMMSSQQEAMSSQLDAVADWVQKLEHLQYLRLRSYDELGRPWNLHLNSLSTHGHLSSLYLLGRLKPTSDLLEFPNNLVNLTLSASELVKDPMEPLGRLPNLKILQLFAASYIGQEMHCFSGGFPQLQILKLWKLENLKKWYVDGGALCSLIKIDIRSCRRLEALPYELQHVGLDMSKEFTARREKGKGIATSAYMA